MSAEKKLAAQTVTLENAKGELARLSSSETELRKQISELATLLKQEQAKTQQIATRNGQLVIQNGNLENIKVAKSFADDAFVQIKATLPFSFNQSNTEKRINAIMTQCEQNQERLLSHRSN